MSQGTHDGGTAFPVVIPQGEGLRPIQSYRDATFRFLGPQAGDPEIALISQLVHVFLGVPKVRRAYLARVTSSTQSNPRVMLCIVSDGGDNAPVLEDVGKSFAKLFNTETFLDVMFVENTAVEADLRRACSPFYDRTA